MFKSFALAAMAAVSVASFAQSGSWSSQNPGSWTYEDAKKATLDRAWEGIGAGDAYLLSKTFDRAPTNVTNALAFALANNNWQAHVIADEMALSRYPSRTSSTTMTNADGTVTTTTTTTYTSMYAENMRPMRMWMEQAPKQSIGYNEALSIMSANVSTSEATGLRDWWWNKASEREKDVIVRMLAANASLAAR